MEKLRARVKALERENLKLRALLGLSPEEPVPSTLDALRKNPKLLKLESTKASSLSAPEKAVVGKKTKREKDEEGVTAGGRKRLKAQQSSDRVAVKQENGAVEEGKQAEDAGPAEMSKEEAALAKLEAEQSIRTEKLRIAKYKQWKQYLPFLYEFVVTHVLPWPSLTVAWVPDIPMAPSNPNSPNFNSSNYMTHRLLLGCNEPNNSEYISLCSVRLPLMRGDLGRKEPAKKKKSKAKGSGYKYAARLEKMCDYQQGSLIHRVRPMPQYPELCASSTMDGSIRVLRSEYDNDTSASIKEFLTLKGHTKHGYGLCWSNTNHGSLLSSAEDSLVCLWDVEAGWLLCVEIHRCIEHREYTNSRV